MDESKRTQLIKAACKVFARTGFLGATVAEIAKEAGVGDATIYEYFKNKEDLLLAIPEERLKNFFKNLEEHLQGIRGSENKLRKVVWYHLNFCRNDKDYTSVLLLELRTNRKFYESAAYQLIKLYNQRLMEIIEEGKREGIFREEMNTHLFRNMIFGAMDHLAYPWLLLKREFVLTDEADDLSDLLISAARRQEAEKNFSKSQRDSLRAENILQAAKKFFAEKRFNNTTIAEIAKEAGVSEAGIYEYFRSKEEILFTIPLEKLKIYLANMNHATQGIPSPKEKLNNLIWNDLRVSEQDRFYTTLLLLELRPNPRFYQSRAYEVIREYSQKVKSIIHEGQRAGEFREIKKIYLVLAMLFGVIDHTRLTWVLFNRPSSLIQQTEGIFDLIYHALKRGKE